MASNLKASRQTHDLIKVGCQWFYGGGGGVNRISEIMQHPSILRQDLGDQIKIFKKGK